MIRTFLLRAHAPIAAAAAISAVLLCGCATPLAPGYKIQKEALSVRFVPGNPPHLAVRAQYRLANIGNSRLHYIAVEFPGEKTFGRTNLRAEIDSREITLQHNPHEVADDWRIPLAAEWRQKQKINLTLAYDLANEPSTDARIFVDTKMFYLNDSGWLPGLMGFKAFLSPAIVRPNPTDLSVTIPADFRVTASGQPSGVKKQGSETQYNFRMRQGDFEPYVLAGQYDEQRVSADGVTVAVWTSKPISADQAQKTAAEIATAAKFDSRTFGPLPRSLKAIYDVELPGNVADENAWSAFLPGIIYNASLDAKKSFGAALRNGLLNVFAPTELGYTWFGHITRPSPGASLLGAELALYSSTKADENQENEASRTLGIRSDLADYNNARTEAVEKPIISLTLGDPEDQLQISGYKMQLFFFALGDKCGQQNVTHAIHDMVYALRGQEYGYSDFRAALEQQCHQDLDGFFRTWLAQPGIPPDFRARYGSSSGTK